MWSGHLVTTNLLVCVELLYKVCSQSNPDVILKYSHYGPADFRTICGSHPVAGGASKDGWFQYMPWELYF